MAFATYLLVLTLSIGLGAGLPTKGLPGDGEAEIPLAIRFIEAVNKNYNREQVCK